MLRDSIKSFIRDIKVGRICLIDAYIEKSDKNLNRITYYITKNDNNKYLVKETSFKRYEDYIYNDIWSNADISDVHRLIDLIKILGGCRSYGIEICEFNEVLFEMLFIDINNYEDKHEQNVKGYKKLVTTLKIQRNWRKLKPIRQKRVNEHKLLAKKVANEIACLPPGYHKSLPNGGEGYKEDIKEMEENFNSL